jgi:membrane-associated phospholipid phosphatase
MKKNKTLIKIAEVVSEIFNPGILAIIILLTAVYMSKMPFNEAIGWYIAIIVVNGFICGLCYIFFTTKGYIFDDTLKHEKVHKERIILFGLFLAITSFELLIMSTSNQFYQPLFAVLVGGIVSILIASGVSYFWKVSMHSSMITMFVLMIIIMFGIQTWPILFLIPLVWWSRLVLCRHTIWQLICGMLLSILVIYFTFRIFGLINF